MLPVTMVCVSFPCTQCQQWGLSVTPGLLLDTEVTPGTEWAQGMLPASLEQGLSLPGLLLSPGSCWRAPVNIPAGKGLMCSPGPASDLKYVLV